MDKFDIKDPRSAYPGNTEMQALAEAVYRGDGCALQDGLRLRPSSVHEMGTGDIGLLMLAVVYSKPEAIRVLMRAGADPHWAALKSTNLGRPASLALRMTTKPDLFAVLLEEGLDLNGGKEKEGETLLLTAIMEGEGGGDARLRQLLATRKVNLDLADRLQNTPLLAAIQSTQYAKALLLLEAGADPRLGHLNPLDELSRHDNWAPGTPLDVARRALIERLRASGLTPTTPMRIAPSRPVSERKR